TDEQILGLDENSIYWWRVRYRDRELNWSTWTTPVSFSTGASIAPANLLLNEGSEDSLTNWVVIEGIVESLTDGICNGISPYAGERYFAVGGLCEESPVGICIQGVDVSAYADSIDTGNFAVHFGGYLSNFNGSDLPEMRLLYLGQTGIELGSSSTTSSQNSAWTLFSNWDSIPAMTRIIHMELKGTRNAGTDNDSYFDDLFLKVGSNEDGCEPMVSSVTESIPVTRLSVVPNPIESVGTITLPPGSYKELRLTLVNSGGLKINCPIQYGSGQISFEKGRLAKGIYLFMVRDKGALIGSGKVLVE
ncbi:MAG: hypothetical protein AAGH79_10905, partial [Bacteroidota bacterium]